MTIVMTLIIGATIKTTPMILLMVLMVMAMVLILMLMMLMVIPPGIKMRSTIKTSKTRMIGLQKRRRMTEMELSTILMAMGMILNIKCYTDDADPEADE